MAIESNEGALKKSGSGVLVHGLVPNGGRTAQPHADGDVAAAA